QVNWTMLIQISDLVGEYGVDFVVVLVAASIACQIPLARQGEYRSRFRLAALLPAVVALGVTLAYGHWRLNKAQELGEARMSKGPRLALIQGNSSAEMKFDPN